MLSLLANRISQVESARGGDVCALVAVSIVTHYGKRRSAGSMPARKALYFRKALYMIYH
jgi:hypothetical protein